MFRAEESIRYFIIVETGDNAQDPSMSAIEIFRQVGTPLEMLLLSVAS